jgi:N-acetylmuramoyl-L-alanine amidase
MSSVWAVSRCVLALGLLLAASALPAAAQTTEPTTAQVIGPAPVQTTDPGLGQTTGPSVTSSPPLAADGTCDDTVRPTPLPARGSPRSPDFFRSFREPLAPAPLYDPPGPRRVGLQAGHWLNDEVPPELGRLQAGAVGGGRQEWEVNLDIAQRTAALLVASGVEADVLPATVPQAYRANAFVALHADGDPAGEGHGFKVARPGFSSLPDIDDRLVGVLNQVYAADTELPRDDDHISLRMRYYYAFNSRRYCHSVAPGVPQAIVEMGYLTSPIDRSLLIGDPDRLARGLSDSIQVFLGTLP